MGDIVACLTIRPQVRRPTLPEFPPSPTNYKYYKRVMYVMCKHVYSYCVRKVGLKLIYSKTKNYFVVINGGVFVLFLNPIK